jgi:hypothetical protein
MNVLQLCRKNLFSRSLAIITLIHIFNVSMDATDQIQQQGFWVTEIESVFELVSEQVLGIRNCVDDQDESDMEKSMTSGSSVLIVVDLISVRSLCFDFVPDLISSQEASLLQQNFYSDIHRAKRTPPPRVA